MKTSLAPTSTRLKALLMLLMTMFLGGCGAVVTLYSSLELKDGANQTSRPPPETDRFLVDMAHRFGLMALFAEAVYRRDLDDNAKDGKGCAYLTAPAQKDNAEVTRYGMPNGHLGKAGWQRWKPEAAPENVTACLDHDSGLYYETYVYRNDDGKYEEAVIAIRGTENRAGQAFKDWGSNLTAFFGFEPRQYAVARLHMPPLIKALESVLVPQNDGAKIYVTGHSLGGGLAQQTGYQSKKVKEVFTFNTSPVTNWSHLRLDGKIDNAYPIFHRIYHGGEILEKVRFISTSVTQARYGRHDLGLQLEGRSSFSGHSMQIIACNFAELIAARRDIPTAEHHYPVHYIDHVLLTAAKPSKLCPKAEVKPKAGTAAVTGQP